MNDINNIWQKTLDVSKTEVTEVSFNTWIQPIKPVSMDNNKETVTLSIYSDFAKGILESRYLKLIESSIKKVTAKNYKIFIYSEEDLLNQSNTDDHNNDIEISQYKENVTDELYLNPKYMFDTFVVGSSNRFAHAASLAVAESPAKAYNPLFLYGGVGLGKTHLMHSIGHYILQNNPRSKILYVSSEKFTNELIKAIKDDKNIEFRNRFRKIDVLLIDDIQFIAGKERTQEEFFHTFNTLYESNKQIIVSSDRPPKEIPTLEERLRSRFEWGLIADVQPPDYETRVAILQKKAEIEKIPITSNLQEVIELIAEKIQSNIRELEGSLIRIVAYASLTNKEINTTLAKEALINVFSSKTRKVTPELIKKNVSNYFNLKPNDLESKKRSRDITFPRHIAMFLCRDLTDLSLPKIGELFGGRDHTTVIHACDKISKEKKINSNVNEILNSLKKDIKKE